ncbi:MAG: hypothetical protein ACOCTI_03900 [Phycisphaeraceae bacterium]
MKIYWSFKSLPEVRALNPVHQEPVTRVAHRRSRNSWQLIGVVAAVGGTGIAWGVRVLLHRWAPWTQSSDLIDFLIFGSVPMVVTLATNSLYLGSRGRQIVRQLLPGYCRACGWELDPASASGETVRCLMCGEQQDWQDLDDHQLLTWLARLEEEA